jgi:acetolactate synthase regulatory subunit
MGLPIFSIRPTQAETEIEIKVDSNTSVAAAANQLTKAMSKMQVSQVLLQALSEQFAV